MSTQFTCYHCGDSVSDKKVIHYDEKAFCCQGCKTVFELLKQNDLCTYYQPETKGNKVNEDIFGDRFAFLDTKEAKSKLLQFSENGIGMVSFFIPKIHCSSCVYLLERLHKFNTNILESRINFGKKTLNITFRENEINLRNIAELLVNLGYEPSISLHDLEKSKQSKIDYSLWYKVGIAGFCFGNLMLFSVPEYLGELAIEYKHLFGFLNIVLSLPILFYADTDYFKSAFKAFQQKRLNIDVPIVLGIIALFTVSVYEILTETGAGYLDSFGGLIFFLLIGKILQAQTFDSLTFDRDFESYFPMSVIRLENQERKTISVKSIQIGDILLIRNQEIVPADSILISKNARIDYSFVTGEAELVRKEELDTIFAGGRISGEAVEVQVTKYFSQSHLTNLWNNKIFKESKETKFHTLIDRISNNFTVFVILVAIGSFTFHAFSGDLSLAIKAFTSVLIVACPCALALASPFALGMGLKIFGQKKLYLKNPQVIERMASIDTIVFDKTGTLTQIGGTEVSYDGKALDSEKLEALRLVVQNSSHPLSRKIADYLVASADIVTDELELAEIESDEDYWSIKPKTKHINGKHYFDKITSFQEIIGKGIEATVGNLDIRLGRLDFVCPNIQKRNPSGTVVFVSINQNLFGRFDFQNTYRKGIAKTITDLQKNYQLHVLSGDNDQEKNRLINLFGESTNLHFNQSPQAKLNFTYQLQTRNRNVLMLGDGLNDAGALQQSLVGIVVSEDANNFTPASDGILDAPSLASLHRLLKFSKNVMRIIRLSFGLSFAYNLVGLSYAVTGTLSPVVAAILMPLSSVSVVAFTTGCVYLLGKQKQI